MLPCTPINPLTRCRVSTTLYWDHLFTTCFPHHYHFKIYFLLTSIKIHSVGCIVLWILTNAHSCVTATDNQDTEHLYPTPPNLLMLPFCSQHFPTPSTWSVSYSYNCAFFRMPYKWSNTVCSHYHDLSWLLSWLLSHTVYFSLFPTADPWKTNFYSDIFPWTFRYITTPRH